MDKKKVAFYIGSLNRGGAETLLVDIFSQGGELPFDAVCIYRKEGTLSDSFHRSGVKMVKLPQKKSWLLYVLKMRQLLKKEKVDIVHAQTSLNAIIAIICTKFTHIRVVNTFHGFSFASAHRWLRRLVFKGCDRLVFVSDYERKYYLDRGDFGAVAKCRVVYNGVSFEKFGFLPEPKDMDSPIRMCMVGSFGSGRNHMFVCQFLNHLKGKGVDFRFTFIGAARESEQSVYDDCVSYCKEHALMDRVEFMGLSNEVPQLLNTMDAFLYSTRHDSFGIAVIEAIAAGLPTFVNDWSVMKEITEEGRFAVLYPSEEVEPLYEKFEDFMNHRKEYWVSAHNSALAVRDKYSIEKHIGHLSELYNQLNLEYEK